MSKQQHGSKITIPQARKALGFIGRNYTDDEIAEMLRIMRDIAEISYSELRD